MKTSVMRKRLIASVITALLAVSACSVTAFAAEQPEENNDLQQVTVESVESSGDGLIAKPESLNSILRGDAIPHKVMDLSQWVSYNLNGELTGRKTLYSEYMFVGKYTYNITLVLNPSAGTSVSYYVRNASSHNETKAQGTIEPGETVHISVPGFSKTSKMFLEFRGHDDYSSKPCKITGLVS